MKRTALIWLAAAGTGFLFFQGCTGGPAKPTGYAGHYGYLLTLPPGYDAAPEMKGETELVYFFPRGAKFSRGDEARKKELGIVRLEVFPAPARKTGKIPLKEFMEAVNRSLTKDGAVFTQEALRYDKPAYRIEITAPVAATQFFVEGKQVYYVFNGSDRNLIDSIASSISEPGGM